MSVDDFYDVTLNLKSLANITEGFDINYTDKGRKKVEELKNEPGIVITAIGNSNQGKSFILSKISEIDIPSGYSISTKGLSIFFPDNLAEKGSNKRYIILDTEGYQNAITISDEDRNEIDKLKGIERMDKIEARSRDRQMTENFLQSFALDSAHIVIAVVGQLTFQDQKFLNRIKESTKNKSLYIVHNLMFLEDKEQVEEHMKDVIQSSLFFNLVERNMIELVKGTKEEEKKENNENDTYFVESIEDENKNKTNHIIHLIMARETTKAGKYYNNSTINFLKKHVKAVTQQYKFDVIKKFSKYLCLYSSVYFDVPQIDENILEKGQILKKENIKIEDNTFKVEVPFKLSLKKCFIDEIGLTSYKGLISTPPFSYFKKDNKFTIQIEYCGKVEDIKVKKNILNGQYKFTIIGKTTENKTKGIFGNVEEGNFILTFSVGLDFITIKNNKYTEDNKIKDGVLNIIYDISNGEDLGGEEILGDDDDWDNDDVSKLE